MIGVPVPLAQLDGLDSLLSIVQMPGGVPVATVAVGNAKNAGLLAVRILATSDEKLRAAMEHYQADLAEQVRDKDAACRSDSATTVDVPGALLARDRAQHVELGRAPGREDRGDDARERREEHDRR